jgi:hypothetical protein
MTFLSPAFRQENVMPLRKKPAAAKKPTRRIRKGGSEIPTVDVIDAVIDAPDDFGPWFAAQAGRLPVDFELDL